MDTRRTRSGQALYELVVGIFAIALVASAIFAFTDYIVISLKMQRELRAQAGKSAMWSIGDDGAYLSASDAKSFHPDPLAAEHVFGKSSVTVREEVYIPSMGGIIVP